MKNALMVLLGVSAISLLVLVTETHSGEPPDRLSTTCVDQSDRMLFRMQRDACDVEATEKGYNVGIFRPEKPLEPSGFCSAPKTPYVCLGAPHREGCQFPDCQP